ncbi:MAG: phosphatidate cytidylyltransferase [Candidatus Hydrogenedentales bacterium]
MAADKKKGGLLPRVLTALVLLPLALALVWAPGLAGIFAIFVTIIAAIGLHEYYRLAVRADPERITGLLAGTLVVISGASGDPIAANAVLYLGILLVAGVHVLHARASVTRLASSLFGVVYVGWFAAHLLLLHALPGIGAGLVLMLFVAVILTDTAAYFVGKNFGRHKLAPVVSPNKTWEGAIGGLLFSTLGLGALYFLRARYDWEALPEWSLLRYVFAGAILCIAAQVGDLMESSLKRDAGVKDSGSIFPGHGGVLDRCDGFLFAAPVLYYMAVFEFSIGII